MTTYVRMYMRMYVAVLPYINHKCTVAHAYVHMYVRSGVISYNSSLLHTLARTSAQ